MSMCTGVCIPPTAMQLGDNDHAHAWAHLLSLQESALQSKNLRHTAAVYSSMGFELHVI